jgi:PAS domain S-box-containing protein
MARRMRDFSWSATPLGPVEGWQKGLRIALGIMLNSRSPMFIWWGRELINLYNDGYVPMLGNRHPGALGRPAAAVWSEIWDTIRPQADAALYEGRATWSEERLLVLERNGYPEEAYFTFSYSPVLGDGDRVGGLFCALTEDTQRILGQRRLQTLQELVARTAEEARSESLLAEALRRVNMRVELALKGSDIGLWELDTPDGALETSRVVFSSAWEQLGYGRREPTPDFAAGMELIHPDDRERFTRLMRSYLAGEIRTLEVEHRVRRQDGSYRWMLNRGVAVRDAAGKPIRLVGSRIDITERKHAEEALRKSEGRFRRYFELGLIGMAITSPVKGCLEVNDQLCQMLGYERDELLRMDWAALTHPEDLAADVAQFDRVLAGEIDGYTMDKRWIRRDGQVVYSIISVKCIRREDGSVDYFVALVQDITERMRAEEALRESEHRFAAELAAMTRLQELSTRLVPDDDSTSLLRDIVDAAIAITAADMGNIQLLDRGSGTLKIVASRGFESPFLEFFNAVDEGQAACGAAMRSSERVVIADVTTSPVFVGTPALNVLLSAGVRAVQSTPLVRRSGQIVGMLSTHCRSVYRPADRDLRIVDLLARQAADWIERTQAQAEREKLLESESLARAEAERAARLKDDFLATLSHELRTPLNAIVGWTHLLRMGIADPQKVLRGVEVIERNARAQAQLIADLLDLSRIVTGKMRLNVQRVEIPGVIEAAIEAVRPAAEARGVRIHSVIEPITQPVHGDGARLQQILWNLLSNAVKFTPEGGRVQVVLARINSQVEITVSDTGRGIRPEFLPHLFQRFRQADVSATREHGGLGIGLALVKELAELHGGEVRAASEGEGRGATFTVKLPLAILHVKNEERRQHPRVSSPMSVLPDQNPPELEGVRVLVVDDEPDALEVIQRILEGRHAEVTTVRNVDDALAALKREPFDVLLSDIGMPRRDGYELISEVRKLGVKTPAAAVTAFARSEDRTRALFSGYQAHVTKPVEPSELLATVASLSGRIGA